MGSPSGPLANSIGGCADSSATAPGARCAGQAHSEAAAKNRTPQTHALLNAHRSLPFSRASRTAAPPQRDRRELFFALVSTARCGWRCFLILTDIETVPKPANTGCSANPGRQTAVFPLAYNPELRQRAARIALQFLDDLGDAKFRERQFDEWEQACQ